ncbi:MAG: hypothetical protein ACYCXE_09430, partial [Thermoleophilia bacterium]
HARETGAAGGKDQATQRLEPRNVSGFLVPVSGHGRLSQPDPGDQGPETFFMGKVGQENKMRLMP